MIPARGIIFDLCHTLTARESEWSAAVAHACAVRLALLSNADVMDKEAFEGSVLEGCFDVEVFSCDVGCAKPEPEIYRLCLERLGLEAGDCAFVGDGGSSELEGAKAAGLRTVFVSGVIEELWPERIPARIAVADHHVRFAHEVETLLDRKLATA